MSNVASPGEELRDAVNFIPSDSESRGLYLLLDKADLGADSEGSDTLEDCETPSEYVGRWAKAAFVMSVISLGVSLLILASIFLLSW